MTAFKEVDVMSVSENWFHAYYKETPLVTAGTGKNMNTMTIGWGLCGIMWSKPVALVAVKPERYTHQFMEENDYFTISFFDPKYQPEMILCGTKSGRDIDKVKETGLQVITEDHYTYFEEASLVIFCKKIYSSSFLDEGFKDREIVTKRYPDHSFHTEYYGEIMKVLKK